MHSEEPTASQSEISDLVLAWYDQHQRILPWRTAKPDPYKVWLSEMMLQQTTVATVKAYYQRFVEHWPTVQALAAASLDEVLHAWQGLGYYARARNLHKTAQIVAKQHMGIFPSSVTALQQLPGVGAYAAAAIAAICHDAVDVVVDANIARIISRVHAISNPLPQATSHIRTCAQQLTPARRAGDYCQALMDIGATICRPKQPQCLLCPLSAYCAAYQQGTPESFPVKPAKPVRPTRYGLVYCWFNADGAVFLQKRPEQGLLGGLMGFPGTDWLPEMPPVPGAALPGTVAHIFTHFRLELMVYKEIRSVVDMDGIWVQPAALPTLALPTLMKKVWRHVLSVAH